MVSCRLCRWRMHQTLAMADDTPWALEHRASSVERPDLAGCRAGGIPPPPVQRRPRVPLQASDLRLRRGCSLRRLLGRRSRERRQRPLTSEEAPYRLEGRR